MQDSVLSYDAPLDSPKAPNASLAVAASKACLLDILFQELEEALRVKRAIRSHVSQLLRHQIRISEAP